MPSRNLSIRRSSFASTVRSSSISAGLRAWSRARTENTWSLCKMARDCNPAEPTQNDCECWLTTHSDTSFVQFVTVFQRLVNIRFCRHGIHRRLMLDATTQQRITPSREGIDFDADPSRRFRRGNVRPDLGVYQLRLGRAACYCRRSARDAGVPRGYRCLDSRRMSALFHRLFGCGGLLCSKPKARLPKTPLRGLRHVLWNWILPGNESDCSATEWIAFRWPLPASWPCPRSSGAYDLHWRADRVLSLQVLGTAGDGSVI